MGHLTLGKAAAAGAALILIPTSACIVFSCVCSIFMCSVCVVFSCVHCV